MGIYMELLGFEASRVKLSILKMTKKCLLNSLIKCAWIEVKRYIYP